MNAEELLSLLDLAGPEKSTSSGPSPFGVEEVEQQSASYTALKLDEWSLRRGQDLLSESQRLQLLSLDEYEAADCQGAAFDPEPELAPLCRDQRRQVFFTALLESPEYRSVHTLTRLDPIASEIAAIHFAEEWRRFQDQVTESDTARDAELEAVLAAGRALQQAGAGVQECRDVINTLGGGLGPGNTGEQDSRAIASLFQRVRHDPQLKRICQLAGRYRREAQSRQRRKTVHGFDEMVGVELTGDLSRLLPQELVQFMEEDLQWDALRRLMERQMLGRDLQGSEPVARGPILVCVDESGSMQGEPVYTAKAIALAMAWIAKQQHRWCGLIAYSGESGERLLALPPKRWDEKAVADWLIDFLGRGSTLDVPIRELPRYYREIQAPLGTTDVIFLTDCLCHVPAEDAKRFLAWKQEVQARLITLVIGSEPGNLGSLSDEIHLVQSLSVEEPAVGRLLSL